MPNIAVKYAIMDASVDHGLAEGTYAEMFTASLESMAFFESDIRKLIEKALTYIPKDCRIAKSVNLVLDSYDAGIPWQEVREKLVKESELSDVFLNPKTEIAKKLIYTNHVKTKLDEEKTIRLTFDGNSDEPVIANIVEECGILVSILFADTKVIDGKIYGQLVFKLPKKTKDIEKLKKYLDIHNIKYEEVNQ